MARFVVAISRKHRAPGVTAEEVGSVAGVRVVGRGNPDRVVVEASASAIADAREKFGQTMIIEPIIEHKLC